MLVVSDTTPLNYLIQIDYVDLLPRLLERVCIPGMVRGELSHPQAPFSVRQWIASPPEWLSVSDPAVRVIPSELHRGEAEAIALTRELNADFFLTDDWMARNRAIKEGLAVLTTPLNLRAAADRGLIVLDEAIDRLLTTNFRIDKKHIDELLKGPKEV